MAKVQIPKQCVLTIKQARLNGIYHELMSLDADKYPNNAAVLMRVFIELSADFYAKKHRVSFVIPPKPKTCPNCGNVTTPPAKDMTCREKLLAVAQDMEAQGFATAHELAGIRKMATLKEYAHSVVSMNAYVHNKDLNPTAKEIKTTWDDIQQFIEILWAS